MPPATSDLRRVSLNPAHWRQSRWLLAAEAGATAALGLVGLVGVFLVAPVGVGFSVAGLPLTPTLSWVLLGVGATAAVSMINRRVALMFTAATGICAGGLVIVTAVATTHQAGGPMGLAAGGIVLWGLLACYNLAVLMWLAPDQLEGPEWILKRRKAPRSALPEDKAREEAG
ncbi:hypothetical protein MPRM_16110 [Mycobacterium parmense]|uniref:Transmembrane protein n=2 Tax=Mycobacterium parmense TaxID=185642 RepID=A0A7I7YRD6_9MYCO|nr:hypothetical protein MPRM_16110 [Mycobacterium parmense]